MSKQKWVECGTHDLYAIRDNTSKNELSCWTGVEFSNDANEWAYYVNIEAAKKVIDVGLRFNLLNNCKSCSAIITNLEAVK